jgi:hypothetical protein
MAPYLFRADVLQLTSAVEEVIGVSLWRELAGVGLLHEIFVALLLGEVNGVLLALEVEICALHEVSRRLPSHQWILPPMTLGKNVPVHSPIVASPGSRLCGGL